jgi:hypothetical protein
MIPTRTRQEIVTRLKELLDTTVRVEENLVVATYDYLPVNPQGISPYLAVVPVNTVREGMTAKRRKVGHVIAIYVFVLFSSETANIDEAESWTALNAIEHAVNETLDAAHSLENYWVTMTYEEPSLIDTIVVDNHGYLFEAILIRLQSF